MNKTNFVLDISDLTWILAGFPNKWFKYTKRKDTSFLHKSSKRMILVFICFIFATENKFALTGKGCGGEYFLQLTPDGVKPARRNGECLTLVATEAFHPREFCHSVKPRWGGCESIGFQSRLSFTVLVWSCRSSSLSPQSAGDQLPGGAGPSSGMVRSSEGSLPRCGGDCQGRTLSSQVF